MSTPVSHLRPYAVATAVAAVTLIVGVIASFGIARSLQWSTVVSPFSVVLAFGVATAVGVLTWLVMDMFFSRQKKPTFLGAINGMLCGLVAITPAAGLVGPMSALIIGGVAAVPSYFGLRWRARTSLDDSLDVVAAHGLGGTVGALLTGVFAQEAMSGVAGANGLLFGNPGQLATQAIAVASAAAYSGVVSFILFKLIDTVMGLRVSEEEEREGLDTATHGERAYNL